MTPKQIADKCRSNIVEDNVNSYLEILDGMDVREITDQHWIDVHRLYHGLNEEGRKTLKSLMRQVSVDTAASLLAVIDGVALLEDQEGTFELSYKNGAARVISGGLADLFLESVEDAEMSS